jgi:NADH-quinone oxidoreductase subunit L
MAYQARDPKRVLAYSTVSQLGICLCGVGVLHESAAYFLLLAHAWSKAALFLAVGQLVARQPTSAGEVGGHGTDLRALAGSARGQGLVLSTLLLAGGALGGIPLLAGSLAKEQIVWAAFTRASTQASELGGVLLGRAYHAAVPWWLTGGALLVLALALTAAYLTRLVGLLGWGGPARAPLGPEADNGAGWTAGGLVALGCACIGSIGLALFFPWYRTHFGSSAWQWMPENATALMVMLGAVALTAVGASVAWVGCVVPSHRAEAAATPSRSALASFFAHGMYLREFWQGFARGLGEWWAVATGRAETGFFDRLTRGTGRFGRELARLASWVDQHVVDGLRWQACELAWRVRRLHSRYLQTGDLQHYMFVILIGSVILCLVIMRPLSHIFARVLATR